MISPPPMRLGRTARFITCVGIGLAIAAGFAGCEEEHVPEEFHPRNDHEAYQYSLEQANLAETALGQDWIAAARESIAAAIMVETPVIEAVYLDPAKADALGYRFAAKRGQVIDIETESNNGDHARLFSDLFRAPDDSNGAPRHVATATDNQITFEPRVDGEYILRVQPELLRGGSFMITIKRVPSLAFPVAGGKQRDIGSFFGDPRDGGRREHHGIDIFARRHTPIIAPTDGYIRFVGERGRGGRVIWMRDEKREQTLYFAHLHDIIAKRNTYVKAGDTIGTVGNTGNARTTPPHLHFGIYSDGPVDPYHFVAGGDRASDEFGSTTELLGRSIRASRAITLIPFTPGGDEVRLPVHQLMQVRSITNDGLRVELPDGLRGFVASRYVEPIETPVDTERLEVQSRLLAEPGVPDVTVATLEIGDEIDILGSNNKYVYVRSAEGVEGWLLSDQNE